MRTIQSRIQHCKDRIPLSAPKTAESLQLQKDVDEFIKNGGKVKVDNINDANFRSDIEKTRAFKKRVKPLLSLSMWRFRSEETLLTTKDMARALECDGDWSVTEYTRKHLIPQPYKVRDLGAEVKITKQNHNANYWRLGDLIKHNKELKQ